ncbi:MAG: hypothetical protein HC901_01350 [Bdellovibrionaceae bacterium]|nr:hypothetical protein [Pseudobdellovibrionaceae bacterium]
MAMILEAEAKLTSQNQITLPTVVRKAMGLRGGVSRVRFQILPSRRVQMLRVKSKEEDQEDPALGPFLKLLAGDIQNHPQRIKPFPSRLLKKARSLAKGVVVDLDVPLTGRD